MDNLIHACLIVDDVPANATYWARLQQTAFGFKTSETGWATNWRALAPAAWFRAADARRFADFIEEFDIRGKFTFLPCPAGHGRVDQSVRGFSDSELKELIAVVRDRIAPRMDVTPEVLTHSMALVPETGALLPHMETAWVSHLCGARKLDELKAYIRHAYTILRNAGFRPHGLTTGGMEDLSGIGQGKSVLHGYHQDVLGETLLAVEREFDPALKRTFLYTGSPSVSEASKQRRAPERVFQAGDGGVVYKVVSIAEDPVFDVMHGQRALVEKTTDDLITRDLSRGFYVEEAEAGRALVINIHPQTLMSLNTGLGQQIMREVCRRLRERYGRRLVWHTTDELCTKLGT